MEQPRPCTREEFTETMDLLDLVFCVNRGQPPGMAQSFPCLYSRRNAERMQIIKEDGRVVSHVVIWPITMTIEGVPFKVGGLGAVGTHPAYRGRGYSSALLNHCVRTMEAEECDFSALWTGIPDFYRRAGWEHGGKILEYTILREKAERLPKLNDCTVGWKLSDGDWEGLEQIRQRLPVSTIRPPGWTKAVTESRKHLVLTAKRAGRLVGYTINRGSDIFEFGGEPEAVAGLIRFRFDEYHGQTQINLQRLPPGPFASFLDRLGFERKEAPLGMLRLIRPAQVLEKLGIKGVAIQPAEDFTIVKWPGHELRLNPLQLVQFFFTADAEIPGRPPGLPVFPYCWLLDHV